jgi:hypothetical protein
MWIALPVLAATVAAAAALPPPVAQPPAPRFIQIAERHALETGDGKLSAEHLLRFPAPDPARIRALRVGGRVTVPSSAVTGWTRMSVEDGSHVWERRYVTDPLRDPDATLTITRTAAGFVLSTGVYLEAQPFTSTDPRDASEPQALRGACRFVLEQGVSFLVETLDPAKLASERSSFSADGEWSETRRCRGRVTAQLGPPTSPEPAPAGATAGPAAKSP